MKKAFAIGLKDLLVIFRDRAALILMLAAPLALTLGLGFVTGAFGGGDDSGISEIPVVLVNLDEGALGQALVDVFASDEVASLFVVSEAADASAARALVEADEAVAAVIVPAGFSAGMLPDRAGQTAATVAIELYSSPTAPITAGVVDAVVSEYLNRVETGIGAAQVALTQLVESGRVQPVELVALGPQIGQRLADDPPAGALVIARDASQAAGEGFNVLAFIAPGMALLFLMYTVSLGGRSILQERQDGTWQRVLTTPTTALELVGGKVFGIFLSGLAQVSVLVIGSTLLFGLRWGDWGAIALLLVSVALAATGWGLLFAAVSREPNQVASIGSAAMLLFGLLSGAFVPVGAGIINIVSRITPNRWALDAFLALGGSGTLVDILPNIAALWVMAALLFGLSVVLFRRRAA